MRRKEREITSIEKINDCLYGSDVLHIGFNDNGKVYVVPVNFGYEYTDNALCLFFHGATSGRKAELAVSSPEVGFATETSAKLVSGEKACNFTEHFLSIIGNGVLTVLETKEDKIYGLNRIMHKASGKTWDYPETMLGKTTVYRLDVTEFTCKENA